VELSDFLLERIAEDEVRARRGLPFRDPMPPDDEDEYDAWAEAVNIAWHTARCGWRQGEFDADCACGVPVRVLAECDAKRQIVTASWSDMREVVCDTDITLDTWIETQAHTFRLLALPYADHPDYREEWRP
jgi:hypothetical protein